MIIELKKFGDILTSRKAGGEALAAFLPTLKSIREEEKIVIDCSDVSVLTPSWADEFLRPILEKYGENVSFLNDGNPSVQAALQFARPKLDLKHVTVFEDKLVFDEQQDGKNINSDKTWLVLTFPYNDEDALQILKNNKIKNIRVHPVDKLSDERLENVISMLNKTGISTEVDRRKT